MTKRIVTKIGDVFSVKIDDETKKYFQYIANDLTQLNSSVIRAFKNTYSIDVQPKLEDIVKDEVDFYAHTILRVGIKRDIWVKVGKTKDIGTLDKIIFKRTSDYGRGANEEPIEVSFHWSIWKIGEPFQRVGKLEGENQKAEIGIVVSAYDVLERMKTGKYSFLYPGY